MNALYRFVRIPGFGSVDLNKFQVTCRECGHEVTERGDFCEHLTNNENPIRLVKTCRACPEQYDAFVGDRKVGYLRLRHGYFTAEVPDFDGDLVYSARTIGDGEFDESERALHLEQAKNAIAISLSDRTPEQ